MSQREREEWDQRFRTGDHSGPEPDPFLTQLSEYEELFPPGRRALDLACGAGRNAVYLAQTGWNATGCDISLEGLRQARQLACAHSARLELFCVDLETVQLPARTFDLVVCFFFLQRELFPQIKTALRPGGLLVYKTYTWDQRRFPGRPRHSTYLLQPQELLHAFHEFRILSYQEFIKDRGVAQLIAHKPLNTYGE